MRRGNAEPVAIVSNHCSWLDILVHMARFFPAFVARDGTKDMPLIGIIRQGSPISFAAVDDLRDACLQVFLITSIQSI